MKVEMITRKDLQELKAELFKEFKSILGNQSQGQGKIWLRSAEVRALLKISPGSLQNLRVGNHLRFTKVGGSFFISMRTSTDDVQ